MRGWRLVDRRVRCGRGGLFYVLSSDLEVGVGLRVESFKGSIEMAREVALEAAPDLFGGASFCAAPFDVGLGAGVVSGHVIPQV